MKPFQYLGICGLLWSVLQLGAAPAHGAETAPASTATTSGHPAPVAKKSKARKARKFTKLVQKANGIDAQTSYRLESTPSAYHPVTITVQIDAGAETVRYSFQPEAPLQLQSTTGNGVAPANRTTTASVVVVPQGDGMYYLSLHMEQGGRTSVQSIGIAVGKVSTAPSSNLKTEPSGERVIIMPAH
ncbi:hypothetical protein RQP54_10905 [Curvibacter sp. APW13]|uniref:hypothetical protein n=1 Tax=Curvibacter sp. APW13 TaxID=3077236 RepID=UPI0028DEA46A|nr:hypothetical protein [Curvibacter sp. APW13]MDT8991369.1 hypothetical protein [Curvibacter sp. APW13]